MTGFFDDLPMRSGPTQARAQSLSPVVPQAPAAPITPAIPASPIVPSMVDAPVMPALPAMPSVPAGPGAVVAPEEAPLGLFDDIPAGPTGGTQIVPAMDYMFSDTYTGMPEGILPRGYPVIPQAAPEEDLSSAGQDLRAGLLQLQQFGASRDVSQGARGIIGADLREDMVAEVGADIAPLQMQADQVQAQILQLQAQGAGDDQVIPLMQQWSALRSQIRERDSVLGVLGDAGTLDMAQTERETGLQSVLEGGQRIRDLQEEISAIPVAPAAERAMNAETWGETFAALGDDPYSVLRTFGLRSVPASLPTIGAAIGGQVVGGPAGAAAAGGAVSFETERALSFAQSVDAAFTDAGIDPSDATSVQSFISENPQQFNDMMGEAMVRAGVIGSVDALSAGVLGRLAQASQTFRPLPRAGVTAGVGTVLEPTAEASGEALAQLATTGQISPAEVMAEAIGGLAMGGPQAVGQAVAEGLRADTQTPREPNLGVTPLTADGRVMTPRGFDPVFPRLSPEELESPDVPDGLPTSLEGAAVDGGDNAARGEAVPEVDVEGRDLPPADEVDPGEGVPDTARADEPEATVDEARQATVYTPENEPVQVQYEVVEAAEVITSDDERFDQSAQPRDREGNQVSEAQIQRIAGSPNFDRLFRAPETDRGAPVVGSDGLVESGNGRVMALRRAYEQGTAADYRAALEREFPEAAGLQNPVVIARRQTDLDRQAFAYQSNQPATQAMSAVEEARAEARLIDADVLGLYRGGSIGSAANRDMVRSFLQRLPSTEQGRMITPEGGLTADGQRRVQAAMFQRAYGDRRLLDRMASSTDDDMKGITGVLTDLSPRVAQMRDAMDRGEVASEGDFIPALVEALEQVANFRSRGETLTDFEGQIDAFADPLSEDVRDLMGAMFNPAGTRLASKGAIADFVERAISAAEAQDTSVETLPGVEPVPPKPSAEIVREARENPDPDQNALFDGTGDRGQGSTGRRQSTRRAPDGESGQADSGSVQDAAARVGRRPKGKLSPEFMEFSFTSRPSVFAHAFEAAGMDPEKAQLLPIDMQLSAVQKVVEDRFGLKIEMPTITVAGKNRFGRQTSKQKTSANSREALDQLLNAYRQLQMLSHVMGVPETAIGLPINDQKLTLSLVSRKGLRGAMGQYSWGDGKRTITMPGMSNSFAHEWAHALDHYLGLQSDKGQMKGLLTREVSKGKQQSMSPGRKLTEAFAHILHSMYGDNKQMPALILQLQGDSVQMGKDGKPTPKAMQARKLITDIQQGRRLPKTLWSQYFRNAKAYEAATDTKGYFTDPAEMFARAFEAMIGAQVGDVSDMPQAFLSKGEWAYKDSEDGRASLTFPKDVDAVQFAKAMTHLQQAMATMNLFGKGAKAEAPGDLDPLSTRALIKSPEQRSMLKREGLAWLDGLDAARDMPATLKQGMTKIGQGMDAFHSQAIRTGGATLYAIADRQKDPKAKEALTNIAKKVAKRPGKGQLTETIWEEKVRMVSGNRVNKIDGALRKALGSRLSRLRESDLKDLRLLMIGERAPGASKKLETLASDLRQVMNEVWYDLRDAGVEVGYESNYLPHLYDAQQASEDPGKFVSKATEVYDIVFQREVMDSTDAKGQAKDVRAIIRGLEGATEALPDGERAPAPRLTEVDRSLVRAWSDAKTPEKQAAALAKLLPVLKDRWSAYSADLWMTKMRTGDLNEFGSIGPTANFLKGRVLPRETGRIMQDFMPDNPIEMITSYSFNAARRAEYSRVFGAENEKLKTMLDAAEGASKSDIDMVKQGIQAATGRVQSSGTGYQSFKTTTFTLGNMALLNLAAFTSLAEPITSGLRSGQVRDSFAALAQSISGMVNGGKRREMLELARTIGLIMPYAQDTLMQNRLGADVLDNKPMLQKNLSRFFVVNGLAPLTHYQRAMQLPVANAVLRRHLRADVKGEKGINNFVRDAIGGGEGNFADGELNELGISKGERADLLEWMDSVGGMPSPDDLYGPDGTMHKAAELWSRATYRFSTETIQDPLKTDRTFLANHPDHAAMYGIMSFIDAFTRNILWRNLERGLNEGDGAVKKGAKLTANAAMMALPFGVLAVGQILTGVLREALFNAEAWEDKEEKGKLIPWLIDRGVARTGFAGRLDPVYNLITGTKYETDLTSMFAGPYAAYFLNNMQDVISPFMGRNSVNTNTGEFNALRAIWNGLAKPAITAGIGGLPSGPISIYGQRAGLFYLSRNTMDDEFAEMVVGQKGRHEHNGIEDPWWEMGNFEGEFFPSPSDLILP